MSKLGMREGPAPQNGVSTSVNPPPKEKNPDTRSGRERKFSLRLADFVVKKTPYEYTTRKELRNFFLIALLVFIFGAVALLGSGKINHIVAASINIIKNSTK